MIVVDTSALMAIVNDEPSAQQCQDMLEGEDRVLIAAPTLTEALLVSARRRVDVEMRSLIDGLAPMVLPLTEFRARAAAEAYSTWGKGFHDAALNFGDSFAYALAVEHDCPLLFVGDDFAQTDVQRAI